MYDTAIKNLEAEIERLVAEIIAHNQEIPAEMEAHNRWDGKRYHLNEAIEYSMDMIETLREHAASSRAEDAA